MAINIQGATLDGIYDRLNTTPQYHPFEADTFADWAMEAGDIVTVSRGNENYASPVHSSKLTWRGTPEIAISSTGKKERDPVAKVSRQKYRGGSGGQRNDEERTQGQKKIVTGMVPPSDTYTDGDLWVQGPFIECWDDADLAWDSETNYNWEQLGSAKLLTYKNGEWHETLDPVVFASEADFHKLKETVGLHAAKTQWIDGELRRNIARIDVRADSITSTVNEYVHGLSSSIEQTATSIRTEVKDTQNGLESHITQTATEIRSEVRNKTDQMESSITQNANRIGLVVTQKDGRDVVDAASIVLGINDQTGSYVKIQAKTINLSGYVTVSDLNAANARIDNLLSGDTLATRIRVNRLQATNFTLNGHAHHNSNITIDGITFNIVTWE